MVFSHSWSKTSKKKKNEDESYIFAAQDECFVFWVSLEPDRFIELIDGGSIAKDQGIWRKD